MKYKLPEEVKNCDGPFAIYGTGKVANNYVEYLEEILPHARIAFFINSSPTIQTFMDKPVYSLNQVQSLPDKNDYYYLIASYGTAFELAENLRAIKIPEQRLFFPAPVDLDKHQSFLPLLQKPVEQICFYPPTDDETVVTDLEDRMAWYLPNRDSLTIIFPSLDVHQTSYDEALKSCDLILVWDRNRLADDRIFKFKTKTICVDPQYLPTKEGDIYRRLHYWTLTAVQRREFHDQSTSNLKSLYHVNQHKTKAYVFGTGPSLDSAIHYRFDGSFRVIIGGVVKSKRLWKHINPDVIALSDALYFSYSDFGKEFRRQLFELLKGTNAFCVVPDFCVPLMQSHYPELQQRLIGLPISGDGFNFPSPRIMAVKETKNVFTRFVLPIASAISDSIYIIGCDGTNRAAEESWEHSPSVHHDAFMQSAYDAHASLFKAHASPQAYYKMHCETMEELIQYGEQRGKRYYSLTPSYIPALASRPAVEEIEC